MEEKTNIIDNFKPLRVKVPIHHYPNFIKKLKIVKMISKVSRFKLLQIGLETYIRSQPFNEKRKKFEEELEKEIKEIELIKAKEFIRGKNG